MISSINQNLHQFQYDVVMKLWLWSNQERGILRNLFDCFRLNIEFVIRMCKWNDSRFNVWLRCLCSGVDCWLLSLKIMGLLLLWDGLLVLVIVLAIVIVMVMVMMIDVDMCVSIIIYDLYWVAIGRQFFEQYGFVGISLRLHLRQSYRV